VIVAFVSMHNSFQHEKFGLNCLNPGTRLRISQVMRKTNEVNEVGVDASRGINLN
jgi:hypothetical protein